MKRRKQLVAIYRLEAKILKRSAGHSAAAAVAYRARCCVEDERTGIAHDYSRLDGCLDVTMLAPSRAPDWALDPAAFANAVEAAEKRKDAQLLREIIPALPHELSFEQNRKLLHDFVREEAVRVGMAAMVSIHAPDSRGDQRNIHAHVLFTLRQVTRNGLSEKKVRKWNETAFLEGWRERWAEHLNRALERHGIAARVDHRSNKARGIEQEPEQHLGPAATAMERRGEETRIGAHNRAVRAFNRARAAARVIDLEIAREEARQKAEDKARAEAEAQRRREAEKAAARKCQLEKSRQPEIWDREQEEAVWQVRLSDAALEAAGEAQRRKSATGQGRDSGAGANPSQEAARPQREANDNRPGKEKRRLWEENRDVITLPPGKLDEWKNRQLAAQQSRHLEAQGEMGARHHREDLALQDRQRSERGGELKTARQKLDEIERRQQQGGFQRFWHRMSGREASERGEADDLRAGIENTLWRMREERGALRSRQEAETRALQAAQAAEDRRLQHRFKEISRERAERGLEPARTDPYEQVLERRRAFKERVRGQGRDRDLDYER